MAITVAWGSKIISVPKADTTLVDAGPPEIRKYDVFAKLWTELKALEDDADGMVSVDPQSHNTTVTVGGVTLSHVVRIINGFTVTFESGSYQVNLEGANHNVLDVANMNATALRSSNSAGLIVSGSGVTEQDKLDIADRVHDEALSAHQTTGTHGAAVSAIKTKTDTLPARIAKNQALANFHFYMVLSSDHVSPATGLTITGERVQDSGSWSGLNNAAVEVGYGIYRVSLTASETNSDIISLRFTASGADPRYLTLLTA